MSFVNLHVHSEYSLLDGACRIKELPRRAKELGQTALALTDHGVMYGVVDFYRACQEEGIKPIIGCEVYVAARTRFDKMYELDHENRHLILLCRNEEGYRNLCYMVSCGYTEGFYNRPRVDMDLLRAHSEGLICLSACLAGELPQRLLNGDYAGAKAHALEMQEIFGVGNYYIEIQDHGLSEQLRLLPLFKRLSQETGIPMVATNDAHYLRPEDAGVQDVMMCISMGKQLDDPDRMKFETDEFYLKSEEQMQALFADYPGAVENSAIIADRCEYHFVFGEYHLPKFQLPEGETDAGEYLQTLCRQGFQARYPDGNAEYEARLATELSMIIQMGFVDYFLIVSDFIAYARDKHIPVGPGRGSAAGSIVSYCLYITDVDPMKYNLYFERFLNPERVSMPDIDIDFCFRRRQEVIDYVIKKYGEDHVAQIVTFGTMQARGSIRDVARVLGVDYATADAIAKEIPSAPGITLDEALKVSKPLREKYEQDETVHRIIDTAKSLEGMPRHAGTHAAGVVVTNEPVYRYVPLSKNDEAVVCQFGMNTLESLGLLKMDFLALRNLTILQDAVDLVRVDDPSFQLSDIPDYDEATFEMLSQGKTSGVFQMESSGMTSVCVRMHPQSIEDLTAIVALYRPGPMESIPRFIANKHDRAKIVYKHSSLEPILSITYGCIVYQEQVIDIFRKLGGYSLGQADMVRRAISKKKRADIEKERHTFVHGDDTRGICGAQANGISESVAESIYDEIIDFANYAFNKAHAVCYAVVAYQTAWFKQHHPRAYMAALLTSVLGDSTKVGEYIAECKEMGIGLLPPDINRSEDNFTLVGEQDLCFGLVAIKGVGRGFIQALMRERERGGLFKSFPDFCRRMQDADLNKRVLDPLISCGAFDSLGYARAPLREGYPSFLEELARDRRKNLEGQFGLFGGDEEQHETELQLPKIPEFSITERLRMEKEATGLYFSGHPMDDYRDLLKNFNCASIAAVLHSFDEDADPTATRYHDNQKIEIAGIVSASRTRPTRNGSLMAYLTLEDETAAMELLVFSRALQENSAFTSVGNAILVRGKISARDEKEPQIVVDSLESLEHLRATFDARKVQKKLYLRLPTEDTDVLAHLRVLFEAFPGQEQAVLVMADTRKKLGYRCKIDQKLVAELRTRLGEENVVVQ